MSDFLQSLKTLASSVGSTLLIFTLPPAGIAWFLGFGLHFWICVLLTLAGYIPGLIYAVVVLLYKRPSTSKSATMVVSGNQGVVYVLTNSELPHMVKIGHTRRSAKKRAEELSGTGVPGRYRVAHEIHVERPEKVERRVQQKLENYRASDGEFFKVSPEKAARTIKRAAT